MATTSILMAGVGGQGIILASDVLAKAAARSGLDVKKSDVHGMAQRGGAVTSHIRFGEKVHSPLIPEGQADVLMASELLEALRWLPFLKPGGRVAVNTQRIPPPSVARGEVEYPGDILERLREKDPNLVAVDCLGLAKKAGNAKTATVALLGAMSNLVDFPDNVWTELLEKEVPKKVIGVNLKAFAFGREAGKA